ncbi:DUF6168 family protein [uncultured Dokdonia sp.]|uniref:DUF6168 family protein n=1 Tax=uncultured Dokdonia sp. TaxID=575653 RepID=UPI002628DC81|nr:DUF6168 family protein [uncultured Dokdonia sp.]
MIKQLSLYSIIFVLFSFAGYYIHTTVFTSLANQAPFSLQDVYLYHGVFSLLLCAIFLALLNSKKFKDQLGFLYLVSVALKIMLFCIAFYTPIFKTDSFTNTEAANLLIPIGLFLILEVFFISKLLNKIAPLKNDR